MIEKRKSGMKRSGFSACREQEPVSPVLRMKDLPSGDCMHPNDLKVDVILEGKTGFPIVIPLLSNERPVPMGDQDFRLIELRRIPRLKKLLGILAHKGILEDIR
jgi:hypothetical protein